MPAICARSSVRPGCSVTSTDAVGFCCSRKKPFWFGSARCTRAFSTAPVCAPSLAQTSAADLRLATLIHFDWGPARRDDPRAPVWRQWLARAGVEDIDASAGISFTDEIHAVQAVVAGQGIGLLSLTLVAEELASGILVQPFELSLEGDRYDLVYSPRMADRPATRVLRDWVMAQFGGTVHQLGPRPTSQPRA